METLHFSTHIRAPREAVWKTMLDPETYPLWTASFMEGSSFEGSWEKGSKIKFLGPDQTGMFSEIAENKPYEFLSIHHLGVIKEGGVIDTESDEVKAWTPAYENYTFREKDGGTELLVDMDTGTEYEKYFNETWPKALAKLKEMCEK